MGVLSVQIVGPLALNSFHQIPSLKLLCHISKRKCQRKYWTNPVKDVEFRSILYYKNKSLRLYCCIVMSFALGKTQSLDSYNYYILPFYWCIFFRLIIIIKLGWGILLELLYEKNSGKLFPKMKEGKQKYLHGLICIMPSVSKIDFF